MYDARPLTPPVPGTPDDPTVVFVTSENAHLVCDWIDDLRDRGRIDGVRFLADRRENYAEQFVARTERDYPEIEWPSAEAVAADPETVASKDWRQTLTLTAATAAGVVCGALATIFLA